MSGNFEQAVRIRLKTSYCLALLVYIAHAGALISLFLVNISLLIKVLIGLFVLYSFMQTRKRYLLREPGRSPVEILLTSENEWRLKFADGHMEKANLMPGSYVHPWLVIVPLDVKGKIHYVLIPADGVDDTQDYRRLRVRLIHPLRHDQGI